MSNSNASGDNVESPSTYGNEGYKEYRKKERSKDAGTLSQSNVDHVDGRELEDEQTFQY
jgi:hypothetical protein